LGNDFAAVFMPLTASASNVWILGLFIIIGSIGIRVLSPSGKRIGQQFGIDKVSKNMGIFLAAAQSDMPQDLFSLL
jgi:hypothetical protein